MNNSPEPKKSDLSKKLTKDGKSIQIEIYEDGEGGWLLELVDEHWNSTCWEDSFETEQAALDEGLKAIEEEGINSFVGPADGVVH